MTILEINNLTKKYPRITAVNNLNLQIQQGEVYGILGPNGSGKTTTLGMILDVIHPTSGSFSWFGENKNSAHLRHRIGAILETPNFYPYMNAIQNLAIVAKIKGIATDEITKVLEVVGLAKRARSSFRSYSLGMKQRLAIAAALLGDPEVLIFDEPTNGLDPQGIVDVRELLIKIAQQGKTILLASHIIDEVEKICSHAAIIKNGHLLAAGSVTTLLSTEPYYELAATDMPRLQQLLQETSWVKSSLEWKKMRLDRTFRIIAIIHLISLPLLIWTVQLMFKSTGNAIMQGPIQAVYQFPQIFKATAYWASHLAFFTLTFLTIHLISAEYSYRTFRQNIINGVNRRSFVAAKLLLTVTIALVGSVYVLIVAFVTGLINGGSLVDSQLFSFIAIAGIQFFLQSMAYMALAALLSFLIKKTGLTAVLYFVYVILLERILINTIFHYFLEQPEIGSFFPASTFWCLTPITWLTDAFPIVNEIAKSKTFDASILTGPTLWLISIAYIIFFWILSFWLIKRRDL